MSPVRSLALRPVRLVLGVLFTAFALIVGLPPVAQAATPTSPGTRAVLTGKLGYEGGAYPGGFHPSAGTVRVSFTNEPLVLEKRVSSSGRFKVKLAAGTYKVVGCGPKSSPAAAPLCGQPVTVTLTSGEVDHIRVVWALVP